VTSCKSVGSRLAGFAIEGPTATAASHLDSNIDAPHSCDPRTIASTARGQDIYSIPKSAAASASIRRCGRVGHVLCLVPRTPHTSAGSVRLPRPWTLTRRAAFAEARSQTDVLHRSRSPRFHPAFPIVVLDSYRPDTRLIRSHNAEPGGAPPLHTDFGRYPDGGGSPRSISDNERTRSQMHQAVNSFTSAVTGRVRPSMEGGEGAHHVRFGLLIEPRRDGHYSTQGCTPIASSTRLAARLATLRAISYRFQPFDEGQRPARS